MSDSTCPGINSVLIVKDLLSICAGGKSLKISAFPSVTTLYFRSQMFLKKQQGLTQCNHNIFSQPLPGFVRPRIGLFLYMNGSRRAQCHEKVRESLGKASC